VQKKVIQKKESPRFYENYSEEIKEFFGYIESQDWNLTPYSAHQKNNSKNISPFLYAYRPSKENHSR